MNRRLFFLLISILAVKLFFLAVDSYPGLMFGDSASYLTTALQKWIPPDRSFLYGFIIRRLTVNFRIHSLIPVVVFQALLSGLASWLAGYCLVRFFHARFSVAALFSLLMSIEPMSLMFERFILPDSLTASVFAIFMCAVFSYMQTPRLRMLAWVQILSTLLVALRLNFLPVAIGASVLLPPLTPALRQRWRISGYRAILGPVAFSLLLSQGLLWGYRSVYGDLIGKPAAYSYSDGSFLIAVVVLLLEPADFPRRVDGGAILKEARYTISDPRMRPANHWMEGGLCDVFQQVVGDPDEANALMKETALNAVLRNPAGVAKLAVGLYLDFFNAKELRDTLKIEEGQGHEATMQQAETLLTSFNFDVQEDMRFDSVTKVWHGMALPWYWLLLVFPMLYLPYLFLRRQAIGPQHVLCFLFAAMIVVETVALVERIVTRYLVAEAWLLCVAIGAMMPREMGKPDERPS
ncbi:MAG TPA: hypothetical protein VFY29_12620 [Terriglobia bacterium]|nr:hypothetical protein [Terriglobia bacterium]